MEPLSMGGYGAYIWTAYALTFGVVILCAAQGIRRHRKVFNDLQTRLRAATEKTE
jgi:heme exporter protein CcmD